MAHEDDRPAGGARPDAESAETIPPESGPEPTESEEPAARRRRPQRAPETGDDLKPERVQ